MKLKEYAMRNPMAKFYKIQRSEFTQKQIEYVREFIDPSWDSFLQIDPRLIQLSFEGIPKESVVMK